MTRVETAGSKLVNRRDERIGKIDRIVREQRDDEVRTEWAVVRLGLLGLRRALVPLGDAVEHDGAIRVPYETEQIRAAPAVGLEDDRVPEQQADLLHRHYGLEPLTAPSGIAAEDDIELPRETRDAKPPAMEDGPDSALSKRRRERARELGVPGSD
jgi:hypothetical protein